MPKNLCLYNEYFQYENELNSGPNPSIMHQVQINTNIDINNLQHYCNTTILPLTNYMTESTPTQTIVNLNSHHFISSVTKNQDQIYYEMNKNAIEESQMSNQVLEENEDDVNNDNLFVNVQIILLTIAICFRKILKLEQMKRE